MQSSAAAIQAAAPPEAKHHRHVRIAGSSAGLAWSAAFAAGAGLLTCWQGAVLARCRQVPASSSKPATPACSGGACSRTQLAQASTVLLAEGGCQLPAVHRAMTYALL